MQYYDHIKINKQGKQNKKDGDFKKISKYTSVHSRTRKDPNTEDFLKIQTRFMYCKKCDIVHVLQYLLALQLPFQMLTLYERLIVVPC
jgi:hypothetical protein